MHSRISMYLTLSEEYERVRQTAWHVLRRRCASRATTRLWLWSPFVCREAYDIWVPGHRITGFGLQRRLPRRCGRPGRLVRLELGRPDIPAGGLVAP